MIFIFILAFNSHINKYQVNKIVSTNLKWVKKCIRKKCFKQNFIKYFCDVILENTDLAVGRDMLLGQSFSRLWPKPWD